MAGEDKKKDIVSSAGAAAPAVESGQKNSRAEKSAKNGASKPDEIDNGNGAANIPKISPNIQACIYAGLAVLGTAFLLYGVIGKNQILDRLSHIEHARGLITFILTVGTISIALLVTLGALMGRDELAKDRFYRAKEILTILIGVLGTIVGFYFGSGDSNGERTDLKVAAPILSDYSLSSGQNFTLTSFVSGGSPPYKYEISFEDNLIERREGYVDDNGWISETITAPIANKKEGIQYTLKITDAANKTATQTSVKEKHIIVEP